MTQDFAFQIVVGLLFLAHLGEASLTKLFARETPNWFRDQFAPTWLGRFPLSAMWWWIAAFELALAGAFLGSIVLLATGDPFGEQLMGWATLGAALLFIQLGFGQRVAGDFAGSASSFFYSALSALLWFALWTLTQG